MKSFFGSFFGAFFAILIFLASVVGLLFLGLGALQKAGQKAAELPENSWLVLDLSIPITDAPARFDASQVVAGLEGGGEQRVTLREILGGIEHAATDNRIAGIFLTGTIVPVRYASGYGTLREIRLALQRFKESKKPVYAFAYYPTTRAYYLDSVADRIFMDPDSTLVMSGLASQRVYFPGLLKKFGVGVQVTRVGKYKSFVEPFILDKASPEDREQTQKLLDDLWGEITSAIEQSRGLPQGAVQQIVSQLGLIDADAALQRRLVTDLTPLSRVIDQLRQQYGTSKNKKAGTFRQVTVSDYVESFERAGRPDDGSATIAVVYAEGDIVDGEGNPDNVGGDRYARAIRRFRLDPNVKGIVLRVNSPGGSVSGSGVIRHELEQAAGVKPVAISFGSVAASGGYYISTVGARIFAEPSTITGSIGVFGLFLNFQKLASDNGVSFDTVQTAPYASILSPMQPKTDAELAILQKAVDKDYQEFLQIVANSRKLPVDQVNEIAQGRVWAGLEAVRLHLVDELGGLTEAVSYLGNQTRLGVRPVVTEFPARQDLSTKVQEWLSGNERPIVSRLDPFHRELVRFSREFSRLESLNDPQGAYALMPFGLEIE
ncbi:MAG: signal peptide peptidase SppA [Verrucomicrobia bacterium]|nr:signal peptide peptidase SppA [Verrucomicrobiota bacterium]